jgi:hypothetical protein
MRHINFQERDKVKVDKNYKIGDFVDYIETTYQNKEITAISFIPTEQTDYVMAIIYLEDKVTKEVEVNVRNGQDDRKSDEGVWENVPK